MKRLTPSAFNLRELAALAVFAAMMVGAQVAMAFLPNIEVVSLFIILATVHFGKKAFFSVTVFILLEGIIYGFGLWWINYCYIWHLLVLAVLLLKKFSHPLLWAVVGGLFGLFFGTLCSIPYFITGGWGAGLGYIISGIPFDLAHMIGNVALILLLFAPLNKVLLKLFPN